jgi:antibiotic biosynthesis monooxygenase (ABM) superfamily enzyme
VGKPVTVLVTRRVREGQQAAFECWLHQLAEVARRYPGHRGVTVVPPPAGDREYLIVYRFDSQEHLQAWEESAERRSLIDRSTMLADEPPRERQLTGLEPWFAVPDGQVRLPPAPWKVWLLSSVAIYPLITILTVVLGPLLSSLPLSVRFAVTTPILGALMTWLVMPNLSRLFVSWLYA